jgi:hypothetical protein
LAEKAGYAVAGVWKETLRPEAKMIASNVSKC